MTQKPKKNFGWLAVKSVILFSVTIPRALAAIVPHSVQPQTEKIDVWRGVGASFGADDYGSSKLRPEIADIVDSANPAGIRTAVLQSYALASREEVAALDAHWIQVTSTSGAPQMLAEYLALRSELEGLVDFSASGSEEAVIWQAQSVPDWSDDGCDGAHCNNGYGNGSEGCDASDQPNSNDDGDHADDNPRPPRGNRPTGPFKDWWNN